MWIVTPSSWFKWRNAGGAWRACWQVRWSLTRDLWTEQLDFHSVALIHHHLLTARTLVSPVNPQIPQRRTGIGGPDRWIFGLPVSCVSLTWMPSAGMTLLLIPSPTCVVGGGHKHQFTSTDSYHTPAAVWAPDNRWLHKNNWIYQYN